jgi:hypothetical protein
MIDLVTYINEQLIQEGGHVFDGGSDKIKREFIPNTIKKFTEEFGKIFPKVKNHFENPQTLGSVGKKDYSGDIDLAIDDSILKNVEDWDLNPQDVAELAAKYRKRARTATEEDIVKRAVIVSIANKINQESELIKASDKSTGNGVLFCQFPQYDEDNNELDLTVQIDTNFGNVDWLKFAYYSDAYVGNVKGLHRTQLMLHLYTYKGYVFNHSKGVKNKETQEQVAKTPEEAIKLLNKLYSFNLTEKILQNYHKLQEFLKKNLDEKDLNGIYDIYLKTLDSTRCDIPEDLQQYWIDNQERLGLKGKFLPEDSNLYKLKK